MKVLRVCTVIAISIGLLSCGSNEIAVPSKSDVSGASATEIAYGLYQTRKLSGAGQNAFDQYLTEAGARGLLTSDAALIRSNQGLGQVGDGLFELLLAFGPPEYIQTRDVGDGADMIIYHYRDWGFSGQYVAWFIRNGRLAGFSNASGDVDNPLSRWSTSGQVVPHWRPQVGVRSGATRPQNVQACTGPRARQLCDAVLEAGLR